MKRSISFTITLLLVACFFTTSINSAQNEKLNRIIDELSYPVQNKDIELIQKYSDEIKGNYALYFLHCAIDCCSLKLLQELLKLDAVKSSLNENLDGHGTSIYHAMNKFYFSNAKNKESSRIIDLLLNQSALDINAKSYRGNKKNGGYTNLNTVIYYIGSGYGDFKLLKKLMDDPKIDVNKISPDGSCLEAAIKYNVIDTLIFLIQHEKIKNNFSQDNRNKVLDLAIKKDNRTLEYLYYYSIEFKKLITSNGGDSYKKLLRDEKSIHLFLKRYFGNTKNFHLKAIYNIIIKYCLIDSDSRNPNWFEQIIERKSMSNEKIKKNNININKPNDLKNNVNNVNKEIENLQNNANNKIDNLKKDIDILKTDLNNKSFYQNKSIIAIVILFLFAIKLIKLLKTYSRDKKRHCRKKKIK